MRQVQRLPTGEKTRGSVTEWLFAYVPQKNSPLPPQLHATHRLNNTSVTAIKSSHHSAVEQAVKEMFFAEQTSNCTCEDRIPGPVRQYSPTFRKCRRERKHSIAKKAGKKLRPTCMAVCPNLLH